MQVLLLSLAFAFSLFSGCLATLSVETVGSLMVYQSTPEDTIDQVVIVCHGLNGSPDDARSAGLTMSESKASTTLVLAPHFTAAGWAADQLATLQDLDSVMKYAIGKENGARFVLVGFSAGAQLTQRYSLAGAHAERIHTFVIAAPGSYAYLNKNRPMTIGSSCSTTFDNWKYGLSDTTALLAQAAISDNVSHYLNAEVHLLCGSEDNDPNFSVLDNSCSAKAQGTDHLNRMQNYFEHVKSVQATDHSLQIVQGAGHDMIAVLTSLALA